MTSTYILAGYLNNGFLEILPRLIIKPRIMPILTEIKVRRSVIAAPFNKYGMLSINNSKLKSNLSLLYLRGKVPNHFL